MPVVYKHPELPDYFSKVAHVRADSPARDIPSVVKPYEGGKVLYFPQLDFRIDHEFWAALPTDTYERLKKLSSSPSAEDPSRDPVLDRRLMEAEAPKGLARRLKQEIVRFYERVLPVYEALFDGYRFTRRQVVWRLNTIRNENMHVDTYATEFKDHFARLFINLDDQPRIWMTSWGLDELYEKFGAELEPELLARGRPGEIHAAVNEAAFGGKSTIWWDKEPRHVAYFDPGEVWAVDSRQIAHQIFYGRRAVSVDFFVDPDSMLKRKRHYLVAAERFRAKTLRERQPAAAE